MTARLPVQPNGSVQGIKGRARRTGSQDRTRQVNDALIQIAQPLSAPQSGSGKDCVRVPHDLTVSGLLSHPDVTVALADGIVLIDDAGQAVGQVSAPQLAQWLQKAYAARTQERDDLQAALDRARIGRNALIGSLGHELRTPINAIVGYAELVCTMMADGGQTRCRDYVETIWEASQSLLGTIDSILDLSRLQAGVVELRESDVSLSALVETVQRLLASMANVRGVALCTEIAADLPAVRVDARMMRQILINLVGNAIKYGHGNSPVLIKARRDRAGRMIIEVRDHGPGMAPEAIAKAMQPFEQLEAAAEHASGAGLGLSLVKALVEMHEGSFRLLSTPGKGTRALVILPTGRVVVPLGQAGQGAFAFRRIRGDIYSA